MPISLLDGPTVFSAAEFAVGLLFGALYVRERRKGKPAPPPLRWSLRSFRQVLSSRQYWFACLAVGLLGTCWIGVTLDYTGHCHKTDFWNWSCQTK